MGHWIGVGAERLGLQPGEAVTRDDVPEILRQPAPGDRRTTDAAAFPGSPDLLRLRVLAAQVGFDSGGDDE